MPSSSREEFKQEIQKLEAQRNGEVAPDLDENGNPINPHIPQYMSKAPWYLGYDYKTMSHQKKIPSAAERKATAGIGEWYDRGKFEGPAATRYRKGACVNCGALTHKSKDCVERPRKVGAKFTGKDICADEKLQNFNVSWEGKRDRWNGVDIEQTQLEVREKHQILTDLRTKVKQETLKTRIMASLGISEEQLADAERVLQAYGVTRENVVEKQADVIFSIRQREAALPESDDANGNEGADVSKTDSDNQQGEHAARDGNNEGADESGENKAENETTAGGNKKEDSKSTVSPAGTTAAGDEKQEEAKASQLTANAPPDERQALLSAKVALKRLLSVVPTSEGGLADEDTLAALLIDEDRIDENEARSAELTNRADQGAKRGEGVEAKVSSRSLRMREDMPKFLKKGPGTDMYYDPKSRSLRGAFNPDENPDGGAYLAGNWVKGGTEAAPSVDELQAFCYDVTKRMQEAGRDKYISMAAMPTKAERAYRKDREKKEELKAERASTLLGTYGGAEHLRPLPDELRQVTEVYTEFRRDGTVLKGAETTVTISKYQEDVHPNGHTSVFGSYWEAGQWGYKCCKSLLKNSLCLGEAAPRAENPEETQLETDAKKEELLAEMAELEKQMLATGGEPAAKRARKEKKKGKMPDAAAAAAAAGRKLTREEEEAENLRQIAEGYRPSEAEMHELRRTQLSGDDPLREFKDKGDT